LAERLCCIGRSDGQAVLTGEVRCSVPFLASSSIRVRRVPLPAEVIVVAVRWYVRYGLSYRVRRVSRARRHSA